MWSGHCGGPSCVQIYELVREKYTGQNIIRHGSMSNWSIERETKSLLQHCMWCGHCGGSSCVQIYELVREKYTGRNISRSGQLNSDNNDVRRVSAISNSSYSMLQPNQHMPDTSANPSSLGEESLKMTPQPPHVTIQEAAESVPEDSAGKRTLYNPTHTNSARDGERCMPPPTDSRRPSILKLPPTNPTTNKRIPHHVQFAESQ